MEAQRNFLEKLQSADEETKKRWMVVSTVIIMAIVIYIWLAYFNNLIAGISAEQQTAQAAPVAGVSPWQAVKNGMASIYDVFINQARGLGAILQAPREYIINPPK